MLADPARRWLRHVASRSLRDALIERGIASDDLVVDECARPDDPALDRAIRLFVSWHNGPTLLGCIGTLEPWSRLEKGVARYSVLAALEDRRTPDIDPSRLSELTCDISLLGEPQKLDAVGIDAIAGRLRPGEDGVILSHSNAKAFFLPVVWKTLPDPHDFLLALCKKAGIDANLHGHEVTAEILEVEAF